jgi:hypothetical protein
MFVDDVSVVHWGCSTSGNIVYAGFEEYASMTMEEYTYKLQVLVIRDSSCSKNDIKCLDFHDIVPIRALDYILLTGLFDVLQRFTLGGYDLAHRSLLVPYRLVLLCLLLVCNWIVCVGLKKSIVIVVVFWFFVCI